MEDYTPNSYKYKEQQREKESAEEKKKVEKVVDGTVKVKKKNEIHKLADVFTSEDATNVGTYILMDVIVPAVKDLVEDIVTHGIRMILRGEAGSRKKNTPASKVSYGKYYEKERDRGYTNTTKTRAGYDYDDIILDNRGEAEDVISRLEELIDMYGTASVADLYELVGISGNYTDNKYGWTDIHSAKVVSVREGYLLKLPRALPLN